MMRTGDFITRQCNALLENKRLAIIYAVALSILPFAAWLSVALVALVTLRRGAKSGLDVLLPALVAHSVPLMMLVPLSTALTSALMAYLPCYFAAICLRNAEKWQIVFGAFLIQVLVGCLFIQLLAPDFIMGQFNQFKSLMMQYQELVNPGVKKISSINFEQVFFGVKMSSVSLAQLFFGVQILSVVVSTIISLMFARSIQARLFFPGAFRAELLTFRGDKLSFLVLMAVSLGSYFEVPLAINVLPIVLCYFLASGFCLAYYIFARKSQIKVFLLLVLLIFLKPTFVLFAYIVFGSLDSLFNFRSYLPTRVRESI